MAQLNRKIFAMYSDQPIDLFWDSSQSITPETLQAIQGAGFTPRPVCLEDLCGDSEVAKRSPRVVCIQGCGGTNEFRIKRLKEQLGPKTFLILRIDSRNFDDAIAGLKSGADDVVEADASTAKWSKIAASARIRLIKFESFVFVDQSSQDLLALVERVGASDVTALLQGPTGSGKEVFARLTHDFSPRRDKPFVPVNCAALPENLAESLLFGHKKGAFTGATRDTDGFFRQADGGTLFLDEIGELSAQIQAKLLRAIQEKEVLPVGSSKSSSVDVRLVSATNRNLRDSSVNAGFREDLYFRISTFKINVPSLQNRPDDIIPLANFFILKHARHEEPIKLLPKAITKLISHTWPGNVRELENVMQRAIVLCNGQEIDSIHLVFDEPAHSIPTNLSEAEPGISKRNANEIAKEDQSRTDSLQEAVEASEFRIIAAAVESAPNKLQAAKQLGISERTLRYKLAKMREKQSQEGYKYAEAL